MGDEQRDAGKKDAPKYTGADILATVVWVSAFAFTYLTFLKALGADDLWPWGAILGVVVAASLALLIHELGMRRRQFFAAGRWWPLSRDR